MIHIFVPSKGRATAGHVANGPLLRLPPGQPCTYVVPYEEGPAYRALGLDVICRPQGMFGIAAAREYIGQEALRRGLPYFMMIDDDRSFVVRESETSLKMVPATVADVAEMLEAVEAHLQEYAVVGVSCRTGNNYAGVGGKDLIMKNTRILACTAYQTEPFLSVDHRRVMLMEDLDVNLQLLLAGHEIAVLYYWGKVQKQFNAEGGCSTYRDKAAHTRESYKLSLLHPDLVTVKERAASDHRWTTQVVQWKKAHAIGQRRKEASK